MSGRRLLLWIGFWLLVCGLATTPLGAMGGFLAGFAVAMYGGAAGVALQAVAKTLGLEVSWSEAGQIIWIVTAFSLAAVLLVLLVRAAFRWARGSHDAARHLLARAVHLVGGCAAIMLCVKALTGAWRL